jgi:hypothetical protein
MVLRGWSGRTELQYLIPWYKVTSWPGIPPPLPHTNHASVVSLSALVSEWLQENNGHTYLARNDGWAPYVWWRRQKQQDGSAVTSRTFPSSVTCAPQYVCIHRWWLREAGLLNVNRHDSKQWRIVHTLGFEEAHTISTSKHEVRHAMHSSHTVVWQPLISSSCTHTIAKKFR